MGEKTKRVVRVKCRGCKQEFFNNDPTLIKKTGGYFCQQCYEKKERESEDWKGLIDTIMEYYNLDKPTGMILSQLKEYTSLYGYSHAGMTYTLWYCKEILEMEFDESYGVGCIKFNYDRARRFFDQQEKISQSAQNQRKVQEKKVRVDLSKVNKRRNTKIVDFNSLLRG